MTFCCDDLRARAEHTCDLHPDRWDCPDCLVTRSSRGTFGLMIHDGGTSSIRIAFCPWCGARLPTDSDDPHDCRGAADGSQG